MRVRHYAQGKFYTIECPQGTEVVRRSDSTDHLLVPLNGQAIRIPADPPELLPMLAETGNFGITQVGEPEPGVDLAGVACPDCGHEFPAPKVQVERTATTLEILTTGKPQWIPVDGVTYHRHEKQGGRP